MASDPASHPASHPDRLAFFSEADAKTMACDKNPENMQDVARLVNLTPFC